MASDDLLTYQQGDFLSDVHNNLHAMSKNKVANKKVKHHHNSIGIVILFTRM